MAIEKYNNIASIKERNAFYSEYLEKLKTFIE